MNKKRITLLCSSFPPEKGAAPLRMYHVAQMLQRRGYEVHVLCAMPNYPTGTIFLDYRGKIIVKEQLEGIHITRTWLIPTHSSNKIKRIISLLSYITSLCFFGLFFLLRSKADIIIVSSPPFATGYIGLILARFTRAKTILNVSDLWPQTAFDLGFFKKGFFYRFLLNRERKMYARADAFSVQSEQIKLHIALSESTKPIFVYRNLQPNMEYALQERPQGKRKIVYAGLLGIAQSVYKIISTINFEELGTELHIYGQGYELNDILDWIEKNPNRGIVYQGSVEAKEIPSVLTAYHAMLIPLVTTIEGAVPSKIFNAMANAMPILFSGNGEGAAIVERTQTGFVSPAGDYASLKTNIESFVCLEEAEYQKLRINAIACSENEFNKAKQDELFVEFIEQL